MNGPHLFAAASDSGGAVLEFANERAGEAGIAIPSGRAEITIRNLDTLREMVAQNATLPPEKARPTAAESHIAKTPPRMPLRP